MAASALSRSSSPLCDMTKRTPADSPAMPGRFGVPLSNRSGSNSGWSRLEDRLPVPPWIRLSGTASLLISSRPVPMGPYSPL